MRRTLIAVPILVMVFAATALAGGNKQLMSEKMATQDLKRNIVESVIGLKVKSEGKFGLTEDPNLREKTLTAAVIKGVIIDKMIYDKEKDIALAFGHLDLGDIVNVLGEWHRFKGVRVEGFGFGTTSAAVRPPLMALRAALVNAYDELAQVMIGEKILSTSTTENFVLTKDVNRSKVCAAIFGAYIPNIELNSPNRGWGWDSSGNAFVKLEIDARKVRDILGNLMVYSGPNIIEVTGRGATVDELSDQEPGSMIRNSGSKTKAMSLDVPLGQEMPPPGKAGQ
jgi:hypothetical protein